MASGERRPLGVARTASQPMAESDARASRPPVRYSGTLNLSRRSHGPRPQSAGLSSPSADQVAEVAAPDAQVGRSVVRDEQVPGPAGFLGRIRAGECLDRAAVVERPVLVVIGHWKQSTLRQFHHAVSCDDLANAGRQDLRRPDGAEVRDGTHGDDDLANAGAGGLGSFFRPAVAGAVRGRDEISLAGAGELPPLQAQESGELNRAVAFAAAHLFASPSPRLRISAKLAAERWRAVPWTSQP